MATSKELTCADCLCRICARNADNDSYNHKINRTSTLCSCSSCAGTFCDVVEVEEDCTEFLPDENI